jgi:hypothetical protein
VAGGSWHPGRVHSKHESILMRSEEATSIVLNIDDEDDQQKKICSTEKEERNRGHLISNTGTGNVLQFLRTKHRKTKHNNRSALLCP